MPRNKPVISEGILDFAPARSDGLAAAIGGEWLRGPIRVVDTPAGEAALCVTCDRREAHYTYRPGPEARAITSEFLQVLSRDDALKFQARWGMVDPVRLGTGHRNPTHTGTGTLELVDHLRFSAGNARHAAAYAVRAVRDRADDDQRRQAYAGLVATLDGMTARFSAVDDPIVVRFVPSSLRQVVALVLLAMHRGSLPAGCRICGGPIAPREGPGRRAYYCSTRCRNRANHMAR